VDLATARSQIFDLQGKPGAASIRDMARHVSVLPPRVRRPRASA
jgi:hypothetical protein